FEDRFLGRIRALSQSHDLLVSQNWTGAPLLDLIFAQLMPFVEDEARIQATGPSISLRAQIELSPCSGNLGVRSHGRDVFHVDMNQFAPGFRQSDPRPRFARDAITTERGTLYDAEL